MDDSERDALLRLIQIAASNETTARALLDMPWLADGVSDTEVETIGYLRAMAMDDADAAARVIDMPFLQTLEGADVAALRSLAYMGADRLADMLSRPMLKDGITDDEAPIVSMLYGALENAPDLVDTLLAPEATIVERRTVELPLAGEVELAIVRTRPGARRSIGLLENSVREAESLMGEPLPTRYVGLLYEDVLGPWAGANFGTHIAIGTRYDVDDDSFAADLAPRFIAHEVAHYYWSGNAAWIDEGLADTMATAIENRRVGAPLNVNAPCPFAQSLKELEELAPEQGDDAFICNYSLGERLFVSLLRTLGEDAFWERARSLYAAPPGAGIKAVRQAFGADASDVIALWHEGTGEYDTSRLDTSPIKARFSALNGQITRAYISLESGRDGAPVSKFSPADAWLTIEYSYLHTAGDPEKVALDIRQFYEDGLEFGRSRRTVEISADPQYSGVTMHYSHLVAYYADLLAPGRYWVFLYEGGDKVAEVTYEVVAE